MGIWGYMGGGGVRREEEGRKKGGRREESHRGHSMGKYGVRATV